jgi:DNA invertase Pin-like site-specific DNA recombinase
MAMQGANAVESKRPLSFAPLVRVSTEKQEKQGESLNTQRMQLEAAIERLGGEVYQWYAGQEHATPDQDRRILEQLLRDATARKFNAVIVTDISRWSRDNGKSKEYVRMLKDHGIKFFVGTREIDLYDPTQAFMLGMSVEVAEFFAGEQAYKSIINRIERAKKGYPSCGKLPYGRIFDRLAGIWKVDEEARAKIEEIARVYLQEDIQFAELGKRFGMNPTNINKVLKRRCGDKWVLRFQNKNCGIDETVEIKIPRLLPEEVIHKIRAKSEARRTWDHVSQKYTYLFSRIIFDKGTGYALTGMPAKGKRFYRPYRGKGYLYTIKADLIEKAVTEGLFEALSSNRAIMRAVFDNRKIDKVREELKAKKSGCEKEVMALEKKAARIRKAIITLDEEDVGDFVLGLKMEIKDIEDRRAALKFQLQGIENRLSSLPTEQEVINHREWMHRQLMRRIAESHFTSGHTLDELPFEDKRKLLKLIFGGRDEEGARYGVFVNCLGGKPKRFKFEAYGRLGNLDGWIESGNGKITAFADTKIYTHNNPEVVESIAGIFPINDSRENIKEGMRCERHAHNGFRLHQRRRERSPQ